MPRQSNSTETIPPLAKPEKAAWWGSGTHEATNDSPSGKLFRRRPCSFFGPQPKQNPLGEYRS
ncbi:MAG TPA: hypothetical protein VEB67_01045 [Nitrososphaerales archaeon]|nr:hypothetical protein [Nitrososphaerales archaeon]